MIYACVNSSLPVPENQIGRLFAGAGREDQRAVSVVASFRPVLVLHLDNLKQLAASVAGCIPDLRGDAASDDVAHKRGHQASELRSGSDSSF